MAITILHWNARSIFKKLPELKQYLAGLTMRPDVICIQETHLTPKYHPVFPNYTILRQDRPPVRGKGGGLLICVKSSLEFSEVQLSGPSTRLEVLGVSVGGNAIFNVYNPPSHRMQTENFVFRPDSYTRFRSTDQDSHSSLELSEGKLATFQRLVRLIAAVYIHGVGTVVSIM